MDRSSRSALLPVLCFDYDFLVYDLLERRAARSLKHPQAAKALQPLTEAAAGLFFAGGVIAVGVLAVRVMTTGAAYAYTLMARPAEAKEFYDAIVISL